MATERPSPREAAPSSDGRLPYRPALDGIRALAVLAVLAYHAGMPWARGGFLGVDAFFVLSGYLITNLLLHEWRSEGGIGLVAFWSRRARRLLPALFLMLAGVAVYAVVLAQPEELDKLRGDALATIGYVANWRPVFSGQSYFDQFSVPSPLRHTWSLAIEEQYYAVWPLVLVFLLHVRRVSMRTVLGVSLAMLAASALLMALLFHPGHDPSRVYYGTDTRAQSLLVGAVLSMLLSRLPADRHGFGPVRGALPKAMLQVVALACIVVIGRVWMTTSSDSVLLYRGGFFLLATCVAVVITVAVQPRGGVIAKALSLPPLRGLGLISYGVYLWHWPIYLELTPARTGYDGYGLFLLRLLVTLAVATLSYLLVESPIRRGALNGLKISWGFAPTAAAGAAAALVIVTQGGTSSPSLSLSTVPPMPIVMSSPPSVDTQAAVADTSLKVYLIGDSVGLTLGWGLEKKQESLGFLTWNAAGMGCGFIDTEERLENDGQWTNAMPGRCRAWRQAWPSDVASFHPDVALMLFGPWDALDAKVGDQFLEVGTPEWQAYAYGQLEYAVDAISSQGAKVILLTAPCFKPPDMALAPTIGDKHLGVWPVEPINNLYRDFALLHPDVSVLDLGSYICPSGEYTDLKIDGVQIRSDGVHFTPEGAAIVADWLGPRIKDIVAAAGPPTN